jgi:hypothetical protein
LDHFDYEAISELMVLNPVQHVSVEQTQGSAHGRKDSRQGAGELRIRSELEQTLPEYHEAIANLAERIDRIDAE